MCRRKSIQNRDLLGTSPESKVQREDGSGLRDVKLLAMSTAHILSLLSAERDRLQAAIDALSGEESATPDWVKGTQKILTAPAPAPTAPKKRKVSASARRKMAEGQRKRWAAINAAKAETSAPKKKTAKEAIAEVIAPKADEEFKSKMSIAMKAAWAKRKKTAKKTKA